MTRQERLIDTRMGREIFARHWDPLATPKAVVLVVHGAGEHCGRYSELAEYFNARDYAVAAFDLCGHGRSTGRYGDVERFGQYLEDLHCVHEVVRARYPSAPVFLFGHSMGGLVAANYLLDHQQAFAGCILSGAAIMTDRDPGSIVMALIRFLSVVAPRLGVLQLDPGRVSRSAEVVRSYISDPLVYHGRLSVRMVREMFAGMEAIRAGAPAIVLPMLILHGGEDVLTAPDGSRFLYQHIESKDKTLHIYPGLYHEICNEPERADVLREIYVWCEERLNV